MNPEILRNAWIETTPRRMAIMAAVLGLVLGAAWFVGVMSESHPRAPWLALHGAAATLAWLILVLWGARNAAEGVLGEIKDRTWDFQRLSALSPGAMTFGKLIGPTLYVWFGGALCLAAMAWAGWMAGPAIELEPDQWDPAAAATIDPTHPLFLALGAFLAQAVALSTALMFARGAGKVGGAASILALGAGVLAFWTLDGLRSVLGLASAFPDMEPTAQAPQAASLVWFDIPFADARPFVLASVAAFAAWAAIAVWRLMRRELQMPSTPWAFAAFAIFLAAYAAGFFVNEGGREEFGPVAGPAFGAHLALHGLALLAAFIEPKSPMALRRLFADVASRGLPALAAGAPAYAVGVALALVAGLTLTAATVIEGGAPDGRSSVSAWYALAALGFLIRDIALIVMFHLVSDQRRSAFAAIVTLALLYGLGGAIAAASGSDLIASVFFPTQPLSVFSGWVGAAAALLLCYDRLGRMSRKARSP